ncbi:flagellar hook-basal body complex protein [uncultured Sphingomonas sp.]|uniref:flagellar hook-basal body complex protein n=1 Tax=uncultured Sphingomonas sp. TaxID=158754 RepID=UPI0030F4D033
MFGSIYIGLSGLAAYSRGLQQISNNVANLNAQGFKGSTVSFENVLGASGGSRDGTTTSGGSGVRGAPSRLDFKQGELKQTDRDLDLAIQGNGLLMLLRGDEVAYTRTGSFEVDRAGRIVLSGTEYQLATRDASGLAKAVSVDLSRTSAPKATSKVTFADNLSADLDTAKSLAIGDIAVYDASGGKHVWTATFTRETSGTGTARNWSVKVTDDKGATVDTKTLTFNGGVVDPATAKLDFTDAGSGATASLDFSSGVTSFAGGSVSTLRVAGSDGYGTGTYTTLGINAAGEIEIGYSNAQKQALGKVAIVDFRNTADLQQRAGGLFSAASNASREVLASGDPRVGTIQARRLEASNVDLTLEFSDLILVQRGFQASSQIISVSNEMIQQLFGIRGQG